MGPTRFDRSTQGTQNDKTSRSPPLPFLSPSLSLSSPHSYFDSHHTLRGRGKRGKKKKKKRKVEEEKERGEEEEKSNHPFPFPILPICVRFFHNIFEEEAAEEEQEEEEERSRWLLLRGGDLGLGSPNRSVIHVFLSLFFFFWMNCCCVFSTLRC